MIEALTRTGIDGKDIRIITELYWNQKAAIRVEEDLSNPAEIKRGVRQGCVLSPYLFNIYTEYIFRESNDLRGIQIHGQNINNIRYVDDTTLLANNEKDLQMIFDTVKEQSEKNGLNMNVSKTKTMVISKNNELKVNIKADAEILEQVDHFKYLGQIVNKDLKNDQEIIKRIAQAKSTFINMSDILTSRDISLKLRLKIISLYIYPIILYGDETWTLYTETINRIEAFEMWIFRRLARVSYKVKIE